MNPKEFKNQPCLFFGLSYNQRGLKRLPGNLLREIEVILVDDFIGTVLHYQKFKF
jgi:hypothetical protein